MPAYPWIQQKGNNPFLITNQPTNSDSNLQTEPRGFQQTITAKACTDKTSIMVVRQNPKWKELNNWAIS